MNNIAHLVSTIATAPSCPMRLVTTKRVARNQPHPQDISMYSLKCYWGDGDDLSLNLKFHRKISESMIRQKWMCNIKNYVIAHKVKQWQEIDLVSYRQQEETSPTLPCIVRFLCTKIFHGISPLLHLLPSSIIEKAHLCSLHCTHIRMPSSKKVETRQNLHLSILRIPS